MKRFTCPVCGTEVHYRNTACLTCGTYLALRPEVAAMEPVEEAVALCRNRGAIGCNWIAGSGSLCECCAATETIPDLKVPGNEARWARLEESKARLWYSLMQFGLPRDGLRFRFLGDRLGLDGNVQKRVLTGHEHGLVTLNIAEADDDMREAARVRMGEPYRALARAFPP